MSEVKKTSIGGQALIEGILMRGPGKLSIVVRDQKGAIRREVKPVVTLGDRYPFFKLPFIRGVVGIFESMRMGMSALSYSADVYAEEEGEAEKETKESFWDKLFGKHKETVESVVTVLLSLGLGIGLFFLLPTIMTSFFRPYVSSLLAMNLIEGLIRVVIFFIYLVLIARSKDIHRVLEYHGAEHKSIHCYEHGLELTVENVQKFSRLHPRCGTSFVFTVILLSIFILSFFGWPNPWVRLVTRILMLPVIAGISYEVNHYLGGCDGKLAKALITPGLLVQKYATVKEPEDDMVEVAIIALKDVIPEEEGADAW